MKYVNILATGSYLPEKILTNKDLEKMVDTTDEWIVTRTGMQKRHIMSDNETTATMAEQAAKRAITTANIDPQAIDLIIVATCTPEKFFPNTACLIQTELGIKQCIAFDISAACTGFIYALDVASQYIRNGIAQHALVVGTEGLTRIVDWSDRNTCVLFGDGAGAMVLKAGDKPGIIGCKLYADGSKQDLLEYPTPIYRKPDAPKRYLHMQGRDVFKVAVTGMTNAVFDLLDACNLDISEVDWIVPHQANYRIIDLVIEKLKFPKEHVIMTIAEHANTSSASIPLAFDAAVRKGTIKRGDTVLLAAFGGGLTWGSAVLKY